MAHIHRRNTHALLPPDFGPPGPPFLPQVGQVYLVRTLIYWSSDPAAARPSVIFSVPALAFARIQLVTRTTKSVKGVEHKADPALGLDRDGVFADFVSVEQQLWRPNNVKLLGVLPQQVLEDVLAWFA